MKLDIHIAKMKVQQGKYEANIQLMQEVIAKAARNGSRLVVFPQYSITGYPSKSNLENFKEVCELVQRKIFDAAREFRINVIYDILDKRENGYSDIIIFVNDNGETVEKYERVHKFWREDQCFTGDSHKIITIDGIKIGLMTGDDIYYPEMSRTLTLEGVYGVICLFYGANHRLGNSFDLKNVLVNMVTTYGVVNEVDFIICSAEGFIEEDDNQSILAGGELVGNTNVFSISQGTILQVTDESDGLNTYIDTGKIDFYRMICRRVNGRKPECYKL